MIALPLGDEAATPIPVRRMASEAQGGRPFSANWHRVPCSASTNSMPFSPANLVAISSWLERNSFKQATPVSYTHLTLPTILRV